MDWDRFTTTLVTHQLAGSEAPVSDVFDVISSKYTRYSLYSLAHDPDTTVSQLADFVTGFEAMLTGSIATPEDHQHVRIRLHHAVLPKLDATGYIDFDREAQTISASRHHDAVNASLGIEA